MDDIVITGSDQVKIQHVKQNQNHYFGIKDLGKLHYFLSLEVSYLPDGIVLSQGKFTIELLKDSGLTNLRFATTHLPLHSKLSPDEGELHLIPPIIQP